MRRRWNVALACLFATCAAALAPPASRAAQYLFNGVDLAGWEKLGGAATYAVQNGEIVGTSPAVGSPNTFLVTQADYDDFVLELDFKIDAPAFNSGVQIRSQSLPAHNNGRVFGYQVEIDPSTRAWTGGLYWEGGSPARGAGYLDDLSDNAAARAAFQLGQWNHFRIIAEGRRIRTWINGVAAVDYTDNHATAFLPSGFIGLQVHSVTASNPGPFQVRFRDIALSDVVDLAAVVDPLTGRTRLENRSLLEIPIDGYTISSPSSSLRPGADGWRSLADQSVPGWFEASPTASELSELNPTGQLLIAGGASFDLGAAFQVAGGTRDLAFEYLSPGSGLPKPGAVVYQLGGDFDGDDDVDAADLSGPLVGWKSRFGAGRDGGDFLTWQRQLGATFPAAATPVPEPSTTTLYAAALAVAARRRRSAAR